MAPNKESESESECEKTASAFTWKLLEVKINFLYRLSPYLETMSLSHSQKCHLIFVWKKKRIGKYLLNKKKFKKNHFNIYLKKYCSVGMFAFKILYIFHVSVSMRSVKSNSFVSHLLIQIAKEMQRKVVYLNRWIEKGKKTDCSFVH